MLSTAFISGLIAGKKVNGVLKARQDGINRVRAGGASVIKHRQSGKY
jgi:hypothetical protein